LGSGRKGAKARGKRGGSPSTRGILQVREGKAGGREGGGEGQKNVREGAKKLCESC